MPTLNSQPQNRGKMPIIDVEDHPSLPKCALCYQSSNTSLEHLTFFEYGSSWNVPFSLQMSKAFPIPPQQSTRPMIFPTLFEHFVRQGYSLPPMMPQSRGPMMQGFETIPPPLTQSYSLQEDLGCNNFLSSSQYQVETKSPHQVVAQLLEYDTTHPPNPGRHTARRGGHLTTREYRLHLLGFDPDTFASSSTVHSSFKQEFNLSISTCMDLHDTTESHVYSHTDLVEADGPTQPTNSS